MLVPAAPGASPSVIADVCQESGRLEEALGWAEKSLHLMQQLAGVKVHPALEPYFNLVIDLKNKTGRHLQHIGVMVQCLPGAVGCAWAAGHVRSAGLCHTCSHICTCKNSDCHLTRNCVFCKQLAQLWC
jgi:hypothetical protein